MAFAETPHTVSASAGGGRNRQGSSFRPDDWYSRDYGVGFPGQANAFRLIKAVSLPLLFLVELKPNSRLVYTRFSNGISEQSVLEVGAGLAHRLKAMHYEHIARVAVGSEDSLFRDAARVCEIAGTVVDVAPLSVVSDAMKMKTVADTAPLLVCE